MGSTSKQVLVIEGGPNDDQTIELGATVTLGRDASNDVVIEDPGASRNHAEIVKSDDGYLLARPFPAPMGPS